MLHFDRDVNKARGAKAKAKNANVNFGKMPQLICQFWVIFAIL